MRRHSVYVAAGPQVQSGPSEKPSLSDQDMLGVLANQALSDRQTRMGDVESALSGALHQDGAAEGAEGQTGERAGSSSAIRTLMEAGYLKDDGDRWLTRRGFEAVGRAILREIMSNVSAQDTGEHQTVLTGSGETVLDTTRAFEHGDDMRHLSVQETLLNTVRRERSTAFPLRIIAEDMEQYETYASAKTAVVYCIDLSSTMRTKMQGGHSRIRAAKKALWGLYGANTRYFVRDAVHVIGFASMAARVDPYDIPFLRTYDANDGFLHYTNYQAAFRLARKILAAESAENKKIVLITDGQPSACLVDNDLQRDAILAEKPYSNFYAPDGDTVSTVADQKNMRLDAPPEVQVYLCYRYKKVDPRIHERTIYEAARCKRKGIDTDMVVVSDEAELVQYAKNLARELGGRAFHIQDHDMANVLVTDYMRRSTRGRW